MEVPGSRPHVDQDTASEEDYPLCQPCHADGRDIPARKFCQDCQEHLCHDCSEQHRKFKALKHHVLVDHSCVSTSNATNQTSKPTVSCPVHPDEIIQFYCSQHNAVVCLVCVVLDHASCKKSYIPDIAGGYKQSDEYRQLRDDLTELGKSVALCLENTDLRAQQTEENNRNLIDQIRTFREEINEYLKKKEEELVARVEKLLTASQVRADLQGIKSEIEEMGLKLESLKEENSDLLITCKVMMKRTMQLSDTLENCMKPFRVDNYAFCKGELSLEIMSKENALGTIEKQSNKIQWSDAQICRLDDVSVRSPADKKECMILRVRFLPPDTLLLTDYNNRCIKSVDTRTNAITAYLNFATAPCDIAVFGSEQAAITLPRAKQVKIISTTLNDLSPVRAFTVAGECHGIDATDDKLVVSYENPGKVQILDHYGAVLNTVTSNVYGSSLFAGPSYVYVDKENNGEVVYVSDYVTNTLTKLSMTGDILYQFSDEDIRKPMGQVTVDDEHILVCVYESDAIVALSKQGGKVCTLLRKCDGVYCPWSVCFHPAKKLLYVSCALGKRNDLKVYRIQ